MIEITGECGKIINSTPWKQFFDMKGSTEKPLYKLSNVLMSNFNMKCNSFGEMQGNPTDTVSNIILKDYNITDKAPTFKNQYKDIKDENVIINGNPLVIK